MAVRLQIRSHPRGDAGSRLSLSEVARYAAEDRMNPRIKEWTQGVLRAAGSPRDNRSKTSAILNGVRDRVQYVSDPVDAEFIAAPRHTLCLGDENDLCLLGGDCDDLVVAFIACCESVGIPCAVVGHSYSEDGAITHVLAAAHVGDSSVLGTGFSGGGWILCDPATVLPAGQSYQPTRELLIAVPSGELLCDGSPVCDLKTLSSDVTGSRGDGEFVGVRGVDTEATMARGTLSSSLGVTKVNREWVTYFLSVVDSLQANWNRTAELYAGFMQVRERLGLSKIDNTAIGEQVRGSWTQFDDDNLRTLHDLVNLFVIYGKEVRAGKRKLVFNDDYTDVGITGEPNETLIQTKAGTDGNLTLDVTNYTYTGRDPGTLGAWQVIVVAVLSAGVVLYKLVDAFQDQILRGQTKDLLDHQEKIANNLEQSGVPPKEAQTLATQQVQALTAASVAIDKARGRKTDPLGGITDLLKVALWVVAGAVAIKAGLFVYDEFKNKGRRSFAT